MDQCHKRIAETLARALDALIGLATLLGFRPPSMFVQSGALIF